MEDKASQAVKFLKTASEIHEKTWSTVEEILVDFRYALDYEVRKNEEDKKYRVTITLHKEPCLDLKRPFKEEKDAEAYGSEYIGHIYTLSYNGKDT